MSSIRARLTTSFAAALLATMAAFAITLLVTRRARIYEELQRTALLQAELVLGIVGQVERESGRLTVVGDSAIGPVLPSDVQRILDKIPGYFLVIGSDGRFLYFSPAVRRFSLDTLTRFQAAAIEAPTSGNARMLEMGGQDWLVVARATGAAESAVSRVAVAADTRSRDQALSEVLGTMVVIAPLLLLAAIGVAYAIAGRAFQPVDRMINEVQAITDGRSLHRRLPVDGAGDELARLALTLNEMMERLEKSFSALRRFTADASHELKTPLTVLRADVERAMSPVVVRAERLVALEEALHETTRMADLVDSLLTLARADEGRFDLHREPVELEPLAQEVFETAVILGEDAGLDVSMPAVEPITVMGDHTRLRQMFLNLVMNAIKYSPRGGSVEITLSRGDRTVAFSVRDTGIGISAADLPHVFERFYRADRARTRRVPAADGTWETERGGFGLGLAICQWIAEAHGGTISVRSRLARGSTFTVTLPIAELAEAVASVADNG